MGFCHVAAGPAELVSLDSFYVASSKRRRCTSSRPWMCSPAGCGGHYRRHPHAATAASWTSCSPLRRHATSCEP